VNTLNIDGYIATVSVDFETGIMHGQVVNTRDVLTFSAMTVDGLKTAFAETLSDYREWCSSEGEAPEKPYSGTLTLRLKPEVHRLAAERAISEGISLSAWLVRTVDCELGRRPTAITSEQLRKRFAQAQEEVIQAVSSITLVGGHDEEEPWSRRTRLQ